MSLIRWKRFACLSCFGALRKLLVVRRNLKHRNLGVSVGDLLGRCRVLPSHERAQFPRSGITLLSLVAGLITKHHRYSFVATRRMVMTRRNLGN